MPRCKHCPVFTQAAGGLVIGVQIGYGLVPPVLNCLGIDQGFNRPPLLVRSETELGIQEEVVEWVNDPVYGYYSPTLYMGNGVTGFMVRCTDQLGFPYRLVLFAGFLDPSGLYTAFPDEGEQNPFRAVYYVEALGSTITLTLAPVP